MRWKLFKKQCGLRWLALGWPSPKLFPALGILGMGCCLAAVRWDN